MKFSTIAAVTAFSILAATGAEAAKDVTEAISHWEVMLAATMKFVMFVAAAAGILMVIIGLISWYLIGTNKAPQRLQEMGMKAVFTGLGIGSALIVLSWVINMLVGTLASGESASGSEIDDILNGSVIERRIEEFSTYS